MNKLKHFIMTMLMMLAILSTSHAVSKQPDPETMANNTWISISGTVKSVSPDTFLLDYDDGIVTVEMDDGDRDADAYKLIEGDKVTVNGMIDDDFYESTTIEASSVYVEKLGSYFYASSLDEEDYTVWYTVPVITGQMVVQGIVSRVEEDEFDINTGLRSVTVDVDEMAYNPMDEDGYLKLEVGDMVRVTGKVENDLFDGREVDAQSIVKLIN